MKILTTRQMEILCLLVQGLSNKEIAYKLGISPKTVEAHLGEMFIKLDVDSRVTLAVKAIRTGLVQ